MRHPLTPPGREPPALPPDLFRRFAAYDWPGNVRELHNELRRYVATGEVELGGVRRLKPEEARDDLPDLPFLQRDAVAAFERFYIDRALKDAQGQKTKTAADLGIDRRTLYIKMKKLDMG